MKNSYIILASFLMTILPVKAADILLEIKQPTTCFTLKKQFSQEPLVLNCSANDKEKKRFFGGTYVGKAPLPTFLSKLGKLPNLSSVNEDKKIKRIE